MESVESGSRSWNEDRHVRAWRLICRSRLARAVEFWPGRTEKVGGGQGKRRQDKGERTERRGPWEGVRDEEEGGRVQRCRGAWEMTLRGVWETQFFLPLRLIIRERCLMVQARVMVGGRRYLDPLSAFSLSE